MINILIFTGNKILLGQSWLFNEIDILKRNKIDLLIYYTALYKNYEKARNFSKFNYCFKYIPRLKINLTEIFSLLILQIKTLLTYNIRYIKLLLLTLSTRDPILLMHFFKLTKIFNSICRFSPDLIFSHYPNNTYLLTYLTGKLLNKKIGVVCHTLYNFPGYAVKFLPKADFIIVKSVYLKSHFLNICPQISSHKIKVLPWGIDTDFFNPVDSFAVANSLGTTCKAFLGIFAILSISRFVEMKGLIYLLKACKLLASENIKFKCYLIGYGPLKYSYQRYIEKNRLNHYIKIYPPIPHSKKLLNLLSSADAFVLPSIIDSKGEVDVIPNACLEAMSMELPVITTRVGGMDEVITDGINGFFVREKDEVDLAEKIKMVMNMPEAQRREIGRKARKIVVEKFDKWKQGKKFVDFLKFQIKNSS